VSKYSMTNLNERRITAALDATDGFSTEALEAGQVKRMHEAIGKAIRILARGRTMGKGPLPLAQLVALEDDLRAALREPELQP